MSNEELYQKALDAIQDLFSDTSVGQAKARENLRGLTGEIEIMYDALRED